MGTGKGNKMKMSSTLSLVLACVSVLVCGALVETGKLPAESMMTLVVGLLLKSPLELNDAQK